MEDHEHPLIYVFRGWSGAVCSAADGNLVLGAFGGLAAFNTYFAGHMTFGWPPSANLFLGVWGQRNASRFRRLLRARHGEMQVVHRPPPVRLVLMETASQRPDRAARLTMERQLSRTEQAFPTDR